ncbi:MAG: hypothetical protein P4N59_18985 [Negativicutes bacterium]|nr:hypothetical protein [Negativicutes bacterium]
MEILVNNATLGTDPMGPTVDQVSTNSVQNDIVKIEAALDQLNGEDEELFIEEIAALKRKLNTLAVKVEAEAKAAMGEAEAVGQSFIAKYGAGAAHTIELALLIAILGKLFGVI